jgi:PIN domain nuclease of toxin-antitoxin system
MRVLVDTHVFYWWVTDDEKLSGRATEMIADETNDVFVRAVVAWELATKVRFFKWPEAVDLAKNVDRVIKDNDFTPLSITMEHASSAGFLPGRHHDPFDRMLAAQSSVEMMPLLSVDPVFRDLGISPVW